MNTEAQVAVFVLCMAAGILAGLLYEPFSFVMQADGNRAARAAAAAR